MKTYSILKKGVFESTNKFEERMNSKVLEGWEAISIASDSGTLAVLMVKSR